MLQIEDKDIGGARVARTFTMNGKYTKRGDQLTAEQVLSIARPNRIALIDANFIEVYPKGPSLVGGERFIVGLGGDKFNVIEGRVVNDSPLTRKEADKLLRA
jgi:hypothetical protein